MGDLENEVRLTRKVALASLAHFCLLGVSSDKRFASSIWYSFLVWFASIEQGVLFFWVHLTVKGVFPVLVRSFREVVFGCMARYDQRVVLQLVAGGCFAPARLCRCQET